MAQGVKTGGRKKGTPNKTTAAAKQAIELAFDNLGGVESLTDWARTNPNIFYGQVWPKLLPLQVGGDPENPVGLAISWLPQPSE